jgi:HSP20 family protein
MDNREEKSTLNRYWPHMLIPKRAIEGWWAPELPFGLHPFFGVREPSADLIEADGEFKVYAEMPGIPKDHIDINVDNKSIEITAKFEEYKVQEKEDFVRHERSYSKIYKSMNFPQEVAPKKATARLNNGVLEVKVQKKTPKETKTHRLEIQ